eukprot:scaffold3984_cov65-Phaeocystis_antarctica.AAC.10
MVTPLLTEQHSNSKAVELYLKKRNVAFSNMDLSRKRNETKKKYLGQIDAMYAEGLPPTSRL